MNNLRIIYPTPEGGVAIITPIPDCGLSIEEIEERFAAWAFDEAERRERLSGAVFSRR